MSNQNEINKMIQEEMANYTQEERDELIKKAAIAQEAKYKTHRYHKESQDFVSAHGQFLTSIINGWASNGESFMLPMDGTNMKVYEDAYSIAADMAANYVRRLNEYMDNREENMPNFEEGIQ